MSVFRYTIQQSIVIILIIIKQCMHQKVEFIYGCVIISIANKLEMANWTGNVL